MEKYFEINQPGFNIHCKLYCENPREAKSVVVCGHGFGGHKDNKAVARFADRVLSKNRKVAICCFDWPGHGDDVRRKLRLEDCFDYLEKVTAYLKERFGTEELYGYATSFGGYLFLQYLAKRGRLFRKAALRCPAVGMYQVLTQTIMDKELLATVEKGRDALVGFDRKVQVDGEFLRQLRENPLDALDFLDYAEDLLILHGTSDEIVPFESSRAFAENNLIEFQSVEGADHRFQNPTHMDGAIKTIREFFRI